MARVSIGSNVRKGPRRGQVLKHRPQGMVDVQFTDVDWVERHQERSLRKANPAGKDDYYDPADEQFRRVQMAIYESQKKRGKVTVYDSDGDAIGKRPMTDDEAWQSSFAIATRQGQKHGWLKKGTQDPTAKGRRGAKQKLKTDDAWAKRQKYELALGRRRKSGKHRVVPQKHGKQTRYYVQPGGRYFLKKEKATAERDRLNGVLMDAVGEGLADMLVANPPLRENWLGAVAAVATLGDLGYRAVKSRKKKKEEEEEKNPRYLDERGGMSRGHFAVHKAARNALTEARVLGRLKGIQTLKLAQVPPSRKAQFEKLRRQLGTAIEQTDLRFKILLRNTIAQIPGGEYGRRSKPQKTAMGALRGAYSGAYSEVLLEQERKRAARKSRKAKNPRDIPTGWAESATGRPAFASKRTKGIARSGVGRSLGRCPESEGFSGHEADPVS